MEKSKVSFSGYYYQDSIKYCNETPKTGEFQRWGDEVLYLDEKYFARTVGIILGDDLKVYTVKPDLINVLPQ